MKKSKLLVYSFFACLAVVVGVFGASAEVVTLSFGNSTCAVDTDDGARIVSWKTDGDERLWMPPKQAEKTDGRWRHGGIPLCWPWICDDWPENAKRSPHGLAWCGSFKVVERKTDAWGDTLRLSFAAGGLSLEYAVTLSDGLSFEVRTRNASAEPRPCQLSIHPYFRLAERDRTSVVGLDGFPYLDTRGGGNLHGVWRGSLPLTEEYDHEFFGGGKPIAVTLREAGGRSLDLAMQEGNVVVWNPGADWTVEGEMLYGGLPTDAYRRFVSVEPTDVKRTLGPGEERAFSASFRPHATKACAGFAGRDPRVPGFAAENFKLPFRAMFIGAHPDDADAMFGATAVKLVKDGAKVMFVSVCNGDKGHQSMFPEDLAARRYRETQESAKVYGIEKYVVMGEHDCIVEPTVNLRQRVVRLIREFAPHMVVTHRTCDYHADHRATGQVVQDATYLLGVPLFCPETAVPETLPFVMYAGDRFTLPRPFRPDLLVEGDDVLETTLRALACHESQFFEWLPPEYGIDPKTIPAGAAERIGLLRQHLPDDLHLNASVNRDLVDRVFPGRNLRCVDAFELCEYARPPCQKEIDYLVSLGFKWVRE